MAAPMVGWTHVASGGVPRTWIASHDGRLIAVLAWSEPSIGELDNPGGEPIITDGEWGIVIDGSAPTETVIDETHPDAVDLDDLLGRATGEILRATDIDAVEGQN